jgi:hypothetical protein|nr:MAG TPA: hypothetical protein [Caudoviricetes sp.]
MKYKVGDKVRVRQWDDMVKEFGLYNRKDIDIPSCTFVKDMRKYCGSVVTIHKLTCRDTRYFIEEDDCGFFWTDDMFENMYYSCADKITKDLQEACDKVFKSILPKYPKHNDMLDTFTKIPKGEIKITAEETKEMVKKNIETEIKKKKVHPKDEDHLKRVEKIQKKINYYKRESGFEKIEEVVPEKILNIKIKEGVATIFGYEGKIVCDERDKFSMEYALYLALAKCDYGKKYTSEGIEKKAGELKFERCYVDKVEKAKKLLAAMKELEKENAEYEALLEARKQKRWERKQRQMDRRAEKKRLQKEKEREEKIQIQAEAYLRAMKAVKEERIVAETE